MRPRLRPMPVWVSLMTRPMPQSGDHPPILRVGRCRASRIGDSLLDNRSRLIGVRARIIDSFYQLEASAEPCAPSSHPSASSPPTARIGNGVFIGPGAIVNARAHIMDQPS